MQAGEPYTGLVPNAPDVIRSCPSVAPWHAAALLLFLATLLGGTGCQSAPPTVEAQSIRYVGSSTVAFFIREAARELPAVAFELDTEPESDGGERAILTGAADLAGIAREPGPTVARDGIAAVMIGRDALAVIVHQGVEEVAVTREELRRIYSGEVTNWAELGASDLAITPFIVAAGSATRAVFREQVMGATDYGPAESVEPDAAIVDQVAETPGAIGFISFAFLDADDTRVRALSVDGRAPSLYDYEYPISRPLFLLWRPGTPGVDEFVQWATGPTGQSVVRHHYPGVGIQGSVDPLDRAARQELGTLVVYTPTFEVRDGDVEYYPHRPYEIIQGPGEPIQRIRNHRGVNDEAPMHVSLPPGVYLIRTEDRRGRALEFYATIRAGLTTELHADEELTR